MHFVTFHTAPPGNWIRHGELSNVKIASDQYPEMIDMLFRSARYFHPGCRCSVITTAETDLSAISVPYSRFDSEIHFGKLMFERTRAQLAFLEAADSAETVIFLDTDVLINGDLSPALAIDFDIGLTWRATPSVPINGGVIIVRGGKEGKGCALFRRFYERYRDVYPNETRWGGDQRALKDLLPFEITKVDEPRLVRSEQGVICVFPCATYNFSPKGSETSIVGPLPNRIVLHFKGARKRLMRAFWQWHLAPRIKRC